MSDFEALVLVLAVVYFWECIHWLRRGTVAFLTRFGRRWRLAHPAALIGNQTGGFVLANPFPPLGTLLTGSQSPLSISSEGVFSYVAQCVNPGWRPAQTARYVPFTAVETVAATGKEVGINKELLLKTGSPYLAEHLAAQLRRLTKLPQEKRAATIKEMLRESLDVKAIEKRLEEFNRRSSTLRLLGNLLFIYLFVFAPLWILRVGFRRDWLELVLALLALTTSLAIVFYRAHRALYPAADDDRLNHFCMILLSPATSVRAHDALARPLLETFHPLAVARVLLAPAQFQKFARRILLELRHPCLPICPTTEAGPQAVESQARAALQAAVEQFLKEHRVDPADLIRPPAPTDATCQSFCPRCDTQFTTATGLCTDCGGLPLINFSTSTNENSSPAKLAVKPTASHRSG
jgi:hypothetical protein